MDAGMKQKLWQVIVWTALRCGGLVVGLILLMSVISGQAVLMVIEPFESIAGRIAEAVARCIPFFPHGDAGFGWGCLLGGFVAVCLIGGLIVVPCVLWNVLRYWLASRAKNPAKVWDGRIPGIATIFVASFCLLFGFSWGVARVDGTNVAFEKMKHEDLTKALAYQRDVVYPAVKKFQAEHGQLPGEVAYRNLIAGSVIDGDVHLIRPDLYAGAWGRADRILLKRHLTALDENTYVVTFGDGRTMVVVGPRE